MKTRNKLRLAGMALCMLAFNAVAQTTQIKGLAVIVDYTDSPFAESIDSVAMMLNQPGFNGWGNQGSLRDFFYTQSDSKIEITHTVVRVSLPNTTSYYHTSPTDQFYVPEIVASINQQFPAGFQNLTIEQETGRLKVFSILTKAQQGSSWAFGTNPVITITNNGQALRIGNGTQTHYNKNQKPYINTICHEMGHAVFLWPDHYEAAWTNLGNYCNMATGGHDPSPHAVNPALRLQHNWIDNVNEIGNKSYDENITAVSNSYNTVYKYTNPSNPKEYLLVQAQVYDANYYKERIHNYGVTDQGLAIYYVDEDGGIDLTGEEEDWLVKLMQADNVDELNDMDLNYGVETGGGLGYTNVSGDYDDLYDNVKNTFPNGTPFRWKDGGEFGLHITNISAPGPTMTFTVKARTNTIIARSDQNGTISPKGVISSTSQTFTFTPNLGYEINTVKVDGNTVTATNNQYTLSGSGTTKTIEVSYKRKATQTPLTAPWAKSDIGSTSATGFAADNAGKFFLESYGSTISGTLDNCTFLHQTLTGDGTLIAHIAEYTEPTRRKNKIGIMIRESLQSNSAQVMLTRIPHSGVAAEYRNATGAYLNEKNNNRYELYNWLKLSRRGNEITSYCSRDGVSWIMLETQTINLPSQAYIGLCLTGAKNGTPARALFDNVQLLPLNCTFAGAKLTGSSIGTKGSWNDSGNTREKAFDNDINTYFDANQSQAWTGLSLEQNHVISGIQFVPRAGLEFRMVGGKFQGSNSADFSSGIVDLVTISEVPPFDWNCIAVTNTNAFRYIRYIGPENGVGNIAEIAFYGTPQAANQAPTVSITSPAPNASFNAPASITINATAADADGSIWKVEFYNGSTWLASDFTAPYSYTWNNVPAGVYNITALAIDNQNATASHTVNNIAVNAANTPPTVSLTSPAANASYNAPATVSISANAADANGTVSKVEFFNGTTLLNIDNTAPYSYSWTGVAAGTYSITAKATDNNGAVTTSTAVSITVVNSTADITGPACASNNQTLTYELSPAKRANATGYGWYFTGSTQSFNPSGYQTTLVTGSNYGAGQVCVGVNLNTSPWYTTYCITVPKCSSARLAETENDWMEFTSANTVSFPNPFENEVTLTLSSDYETASIEVFNMNGVKVHNAQVTGSYTFGNELTAGIYFVKISSQSKTETIKVVKK